MRTILVVALAASCSGMWTESGTYTRPADSTSTDTSKNTDSGDSGEDGAPSWVSESVPVDADFTEALFLDPPWVFGEDPLVALRRERGVWVEASPPPGGAVQEAASYGTTGVVITANGAVQTWDGFAWATYSTWVAPEPVSRLAVGSQGELYAVSPSGLYIVQDGEAELHQVNAVDVWASPSGGAFAVAGATGVYAVHPSDGATLLVAGNEDARPTVICGRDAADIWVFGGGHGRDRLAGHYDGAAWTFDSGDWAAYSSDFTGAWCRPDGDVITGFDRTVVSWTGDGSGNYGQSAAYSLVDGWGTGETLCSMHSSRLYGEVIDGWPCSLHAQGDLALYLGSDGLLERWSPAE